jgi:tRNA(fMet)-specific endonuclease VapC
MTAFDTDIVSLVLNGRQWYVDRAALVPVAELALPIGVVEEFYRGRLSAIRQAESGKAKLTVPAAYEMFRRTVESLNRYQLLGYTELAESVVMGWKKAKIKVGTLDMRIAASCVVRGAKLITRNRRDYSRLPGLMVEYWEDADTQPTDSQGAEGTSR